VFDQITTFTQQVLLPLPGGHAITVGQVASVIMLLGFGYAASRLAGFLLGRRLAATRLSADVIYTLKRVVFFAILVVVIISALGLLGIPLTAFAFAPGALAIGVGFGAQNVIGNFIGGWILMAERPIRIGDYIEIENTEGVVERVGNRSTRIRRVDGVHLLIPNSQLLERTVVNWTLVDRSIRTLVRVGVAYGSPVDEVAALLEQAVTTQREVKADPSPSIVFEDFGDNSLVFDAYFWCEVGGEKILREIRSDIRFRIDRLFREHGIVIAFPQRDVHLDASRPLRVELAGRSHGDKAVQA